MWKPAIPRHVTLAATIGVVLAGTSIAALENRPHAAQPEAFSHQHGQPPTAADTQPEAGASNNSSSGHAYGHGGWPDPASLGGDFSLTDHTGRPVRLADFQGKPLVLFFGYTRCDDACPLIGKKIGMALDMMGDKADAVQAAFISIDVWNDDTADLAKFVAEMHPRLIGLSGTRKQIHEVAGRFRIRRDHIPQNTLAGNEDHHTATHDAGHPTSDANAVTPSPAVQIAGKPVAESDASRPVIGFGADGEQDFHGMDIAHTTHLYLLSAEGKVIKYIYPSMSPEQLAKRLTKLAERGEI